MKYNRITGKREFSCSPYVVSGLLLYQWLGVTVEDRLWEMADPTSTPTRRLFHILLGVGRRQTGTRPGIMS